MKLPLVDNHFYKHFNTLTGGGKRNPFCDGYVLSSYECIFKYLLL